MKHTGVVALNHVGISVADLDRARTFWIDGLGAHDHGGWSWPVGTAPADESLATTDTSADVLLLRTETAFLELFAFATPVPQPRPAGAPGVVELTWAVDDVAQALVQAVAAGGTSDESGDGSADADRVRCPDGTPVRLVPADGAGRGLVGVRVQVPDVAAHPLPAVPGPVRVEVVAGADAAPAAAVDLGVNHLCLDVAGIAELRAALDRPDGVGWHHPVTESSGGIAAVCYGTSADGVLVELLESRSDQAFLARCRLTHG
ncbi:hypothetical protein JK386_13010 [Nocardioides sp. zg-536]|uniref:VOC domain-containing protein n=1 Tax=Nocardioides faecalis TaxID=2803858 RepID=A0A938Y9Y8_9ACTN|nr:VOC family protein [Nocardioides faecalis]MBM9460823.1 hypothetical protein [Nocardioides faecalis]QVI58011.1 hypothetical protein KG111_13385 [Nocardioides faecalis]